MTGRYLSIADLTDPAGAHERRRREEETDIRRGELELRAQIESYRLRQNDVHHRDKIEQDERHHGHKMQALERSDRLDAERLGLVAKRDAEQTAVNREHVAVSRDRLAFDREQFTAKIEADREGALIQARTAFELARMGHEGAIELSEAGHTQAVTLSELGHAQTLSLSELGHRQAVALSELNHMQTLGAMREQSQIANMDAMTAIAREGILSTIRRGETTAKDLSGAIGAILVEKVKGRIAEKLAEQKEAYRGSERKHEKEMAERAARFGRVGFTPEELVRAGFSIKESSVIVERLTSGIGPQNEDEAEIFGKFDRWSAHLKEQGM